MPVASLNPPFSNPFGFDPNLKLPYTIQWNFAVEQGLGANQTLTASYVAALGRGLLEGKRFAAPNSTFTGTISFYDNLSTSNYQSLQIEFQRRLTQDVQALASYTWAHSIDDSSVDFVSGNALVRSSSDFDIRHHAAVALTFDLPSPKGMVWHALFSVGGAWIRSSIRSPPAQ